MIQLLGSGAANIIVASKSADGSEKQTINLRARSRDTRAARFMFGISGMIWRRRAEGIGGSCFFCVVGKCLRFSR